MPNKYNIRAKRQILDNLVRKRAWVQFRNHFDEIVTHKDCQAIVEFNNGTTHRTLLHSLCDISNSTPPPADIIYTVADSSPRSLLLQDSGRNPLHLCIIRGYSLKAITALLSLASKVDSLDKQQLLLSLDSKGFTPLLSAVSRYENINEQIIKFLVHHDVSGASLLIPSTNARNKQKQHVAPLKYVASGACSFVGEGLESSDDLLRHVLVKTYLARMKQLYHEEGEGASYIAEDEGSVCLLQAAVLCFDLFGSSKNALSIIVHIIRNQLYQVERFHSRTDAAGNLTIHVACISNADYTNHVMKLGSRETEYGINSDDCTLMDYIILKSSSPNSLLHRNHKNDIPLHCAIRSRRSWIDVQKLASPISASVCTGQGELPLHLAIKCACSSDYVMKLWSLFPEAAIMIDTSTGLLPFQLAAIYARNQMTRKKSKKKTATVSDVSEKSWDALSVSYFFLRECPSLIKI